MISKTKIAIALSGGVDSAVSAYLLKQQGYQLSAFTLLINDADDTTDAANVAKFLNIPHHVIDIRTEFKNSIIKYFVTSYEKGLTPNPCILCNRIIKFGLLFDIVNNYGFDYLATGHYADIKDNKLLKVNHPKDQSYFLFNIDYKKLPFILFPLAPFNKEQVKEIAQKNSLPNFSKKESQDICFINTDYKDFLKDKIHNITGDFVNNNGDVLGRHNGIANYTIGQRKGLAIGGSPNPLFDNAFNIDKNQVIVGEKSQLFKQTFYIENVNWLVNPIPQQTLNCKIKVRYCQKEIDAIISWQNNKTKVELIEPFAGIAPGQGVCFYNNNQVLGGGFITNDL